MMAKVLVFSRFMRRGSPQPRWPRERLHWRLQWAAAWRLFAVLGLLGGLLFPTATTVTAQIQPEQDEALQVPEQAEMSAQLHQEFAAADAPVSFLIVLDEQVDAEQLVQQNALRAADRATKASAIYHELTARAARSQAPLRAWLEKRSVPYRAFYLVNMIEVKGDFALATALQEQPGVARLVANPRIANALSTNTAALRTAWWQQLEEVAVDEARANQARPYGLDYTNAPDVWALGYTGEGIVIASQDTGVQWDHAALRAAYRGVSTKTVTSTVVSSATPSAMAPTGGVTETVDHLYNWFDAWGVLGRPPWCDQDAQIPCDDHSHGTHTVGTMVGDLTAENGTVLGMAPAAQWIGCRNMLGGDGTPASYTACFEFFLAPYPQNGDPFTDGRPELAPHIINNSWGCPPQEGCDASSLLQVVETVRAAGQMVVASAGNDGRLGCSSVMNPISMHDATFSVGAHNNDGLIASFSSRGPVLADGSGRLKPDISAPGVSVSSAELNGTVKSSSGTSMAAPHVAGAVALLWSAIPQLVGDIDRTEQILIKSTGQVPANDCDGATSAVVPNNTYGYGRMDVLAALRLAQAPGALSVQVLDVGAEPVVNQRVTVTDQLTGYVYETVTGFSGVARISSLYAGDYVVETVGNTMPQTVTVQMDEQQQAILTVQPVNKTYLPLVTR